MLQICAWCKKPIGTVQKSVHAEEAVSHGICKSCVDNLTFQLGVPLARYLDAFPEPILVTTGDVRVRAANSAALRLLGKPVAALEHQLGGDVFECAYARLPEGCGRTIHCSGCAIRRAVTETFRTGKPCYRVPAMLNRENPDHPDAISLHITTVKIEDTVLLRIDRIEERKAG